MTYVDMERPGGLLAAFAIDWLEKEAIIAEQIEDMLDVEYDLPSATDQKLFAALFDRFADWADSQGLKSLPASGHVVAAYILDLHFDGASAQSIADAVASIKLAHEMAREYLDWAPIHAALDFVTEELTPN